MATGETALTGVERKLAEGDLIVSKTDAKGIITYANDVFIRMCGYSEDELLGAPHNIVRHPDMPRSVFKLLWDVIESGRECFAYVLNRARNGDHYWVFAHVTPTFGPDGSIVGYHSNRRAPDPAVVAKVHPVYLAVGAEERKHRDVQSQVAAGTAAVAAFLKQQGMPYERFVWALGESVHAAV